MKTIRKFAIVLAALMLAGCTSVTYQREMTNGDNIKLTYRYFTPFHNKGLIVRADPRVPMIDIQAGTDASPAQEAINQLMRQLILMQGPGGRGGLPGVIPRGI